MKNWFLLILLTGAIVAGCNRENIERGTPRCIKSKIRSFENECCATGADVKEYTFQNRKVYVFNSGNCGADMSSPVYDDACNELGQLGGITGNNTINGESFSTAMFEKTIWTK
jgi:hypothetical protein